MATTAATTTWTADPVHPPPTPPARHRVGAPSRGASDDVPGPLARAGDRPRLVGEVDVASIRVKDENLYGHLQSPEFFDAAATPKVTFVSDSLVRDGDDVTLEGDLTIKGTTHRVTAKGTWLEIEADVTGNPRIGIDVDTTIDRTAYGLDWNAPLPKGGVALDNDVTLSVHLELVPGQG